MKNLISIFFFLNIILWSTSAFGQDHWTLDIVGQGAVIGHSFIATEDGNFVFVVKSELGLGSGLDAGTYLFKVNPAGSILLMHKFSESFTPYVRVLEAVNGGYLVHVDQEVFKLDDNFEVEWTSTINNSVGSEMNTYIIKKTSDGNYIISGDEGGLPSIHLIRKVDANFNLIWNLETINSIGTDDIVELPNGDFVGIDEGTSITKIDANGNILWDNFIPELGWSLKRIFSTPNGGLGVINFYEQFQSVGFSFFNINENGELLSIAQLFPPNSGFELIGHYVVEDGIVLTGGVENLNGPGSSVFLGKIDWEGQWIWQNQFEKYPGQLENGYDLHVNSEGEIFGLGREIQIVYPTKLFMFKGTPTGQVLPYSISGNIAFDNSLDCTIDEAEQKFDNWVVSADNGSNVLYDVTDENGAYIIQAEADDFTISVHPPIEIWEACDDEIPVTISENMPNAIVDFPVQPLVDCPILAVNTILPVARQCFDNNGFYVQYCNLGSLPAEDSYLEIEIDPNLSVVSSSIPITSNNNNILTFELGTVDIGECGAFQIVFLVDCEIVPGESVCLTTHIYPDEFCVPTNNPWDGAFVEVDLNCNDDEVIFRIENTGTANMTTSKNFVIVEDDILLFQDDFQLDALEFEEITLPANGASYYLIAEQVDFAPGDPFTSAWLEGCGENAMGGTSLGFLNQFSLGDNTPYEDVLCRVTSGSYDPNDKQGVPVGYGSSHFIRPDGKIDYLIRFQNTGTDTAFNVVILDTLSQHLDVSTFKSGLASHDYEVDIKGSNIIEFTFSNIMLPDSNVNLIGSNGFVNFEIDLVRDLEDGTVIYNDAAIYFDYNDPIFTNETYHTIGRDFIILDTQTPTSQAFEVQVYPNPFHTHTRFELKKMQLQDGRFELTNIEGKVVHEQSFTGNSFEFSRGHLQSGIYFFNITEQGQKVNFGKIIIQ